VLIFLVVDVFGDDFCWSPRLCTLAAHVLALLPLLGPYPVLLGPGVLQILEVCGLFLSFLTASCHTTILLPWGHSLAIPPTALTVR
jgi:hypothetical protein